MTIDRTRDQAFHDDTSHFGKGVAFPAFNDRDNMQYAKGYDWLGEDYRSNIVHASNFILPSGASLDGGFVGETDETGGSPTAAPASTPASSGVVELNLDTTDEAQFAQVAMLAQVDVDGAAMDNHFRMEARVRLDAALEANQRFVFGVVDDKSTVDVDTTGVNILFRVEGSDDGTALLWEYDDGTLDDDDNAIADTDLTAATWVTLAIQFTPTTITWEVNDTVVNTLATPEELITALASDSGLDPVIRLQKDSGTDAAQLDVDWARVWSPA